MIADGKFHRDGDGGYVACFKTTLDGKYAVVTFVTQQGLRGSRRYWRTTATVDGIAVIHCDGHYCGLRSVVRSGPTKRTATDVAFLAERGFERIAPPEGWTGCFARLRP